MRGFSLVEALLTMFVLGLMLLMIGNLVRDYTQTLSSEQAGDRLVSAQACLQHLSSQVHQALNITLPPSGSAAPADSLRLQILDPAKVDQRLALPFPDTWQPYDTSWFLNLTYQVVNQSLQRQAGAQTQTLVEGVRSFSVQRISDTRLRLELVVDGVKAPLTLQTEAMWRRGLSW